MNTGTRTARVRDIAGAVGMIASTIFMVIMAIFAAIMTVGLGHILFKVW